MDPFHRDACLALGLHLFVRAVFLYRRQKLLVRLFFPVRSGIQFLHAVDDLPFFERTVSDRRKHRIPVVKAVFAHHGFLELGLQDLDNIDIF